MCAHVFLEFFGRLRCRVEVWGEAPHQHLGGVLLHPLLCVKCVQGFVDGCSVLPGTPPLMQLSQLQADAGLHACAACKLKQFFMLAALA